MIYQLKQTLDNLKHKQGFVATVLTTMSITLGALLCVLTLAYVLIVKPLPYENQDNLVLINHYLVDANGDENGDAFTYPNLMHLYNEQSLFKQSALAFYSTDIALSDSSHPKFKTAFVTPSWFNLFGASMHLGRSFSVTEAINTHNPVTVISYKTWTNNFNADTSIIGQSIAFGSRTYSIIGVLSPTFFEPQVRYTGRENDIYIPWDFNEVGESDRKAWGNDDSRLYYFGLKDSAASIDSISQQLSLMINNNWQQKVASREFFNDWSIAIKAKSLKSVLLGDIQQSVMLLLISIVGLVAIACANIANLFLSRIAQQQRPLAIHAALGARKKDLFSILLYESGVLMTLSMVIAIVISMVSFALMKQHLASYLPRVAELGLNGLTLGSAVLVCVILSIFFALLNQRAINYQSLNNTLQSSGKGTGIQVSKVIRHLLIVSQVFIVTLLVFVNISLFNDALTTINSDDGFEINNLISADLSRAAAKRPSFEERSATMLNIKNAIADLPQVEKVNLGASPLNNFGIYALTISGTKNRHTPQVKFVGQDYFALINQPMLSGNNFDANSMSTRDDVIVNETFARQISETGDAIGMKLNFGGDSDVRIIGIVKDAISPGRKLAQGRLYAPTSSGSARFLISLKDNARLKKDTVIKTISQVTSQYHLDNFTTLTSQRREILYAQYTAAVASAILTIITLFLAAIGLYGILSYNTLMRRYELGTRLAVGAKRWTIIKLIISDNFKAIITGVVISVLAMVSGYSLFHEQLASYINGTHLPIFVTTLFMVSAIALFACYWPLRPIINRPVAATLRGSD